MNGWRRCVWQCWTALLVAVICLKSGETRLWAQSCPTGTITITSPVAGARGLGGTVFIVWQSSMTGTSGFNETRTVHIYPQAQGVAQVNLSQVGQNLDGTFYTNYDSTIRPDGIYQAEVEYSYTQIGGTLQCSVKSPKVTLVIGNPFATSQLPSDKLDMVCPGSVSTGSETEPMTGDQSWSMPVTHWTYKGATYGFDLKYNSFSVIDPGSPDPTNFTGLSENNCKWTHEYAQWITLATDESNTQWAVLYHGGHPKSFRQSGSNYVSLDSFNTLATTGSPVTVADYLKP
jgi:hypothetical protein